MSNTHQHQALLNATTMRLVFVDLCLFNAEVDEPFAKATGFNRKLFDKMRLRHNNPRMAKCSVGLIMTTKKRQRRHQLSLEAKTTATKFWIAQCQPRYFESNH